MTTKRHIHENDHTFFITFTCHKWLPLFDKTDLYEHIYKWFDILKRKQCQVLSFVIMPNHLHLLVFIPTASGRIDTLMGNGKRFMAYQVIEKLQQQMDTETLALLAKGVNASDRKRGKLHQVFQPSFDIKTCLTDAFTQQKLDYIHLNPVSKKWNLVDDYRNYEHSSARFYELNLPCKTPLTHWRDAGNYEL